VVRQRRVEPSDITNCAAQLFSPEGCHGTREEEEAARA
jgi:hypothetical protein